ncbi:FAD-dependent oxidoreductase [Desulfatitalea tepidiphila]|uniref:FAD-dependent oxidoreductase n=1 Tax=Desulfatitalea tepidiphila TaxID=1185843 RepID=UPI0006B4AB27|nr:FAD-dependent oxidoreductase [Desulfatitalea tepidiphila]
MNKLLIIGGSDAGISAALRIKEIDGRADVTVVVADAYPNFSICGLPFYLSGEVADWRTLAHRTAEEIAQHGIDLLLDHRALDIDPKTKTVGVQSSQGASMRIPYSKLLIGTGAESARPPIAGIDLPGVFFLRWMADSFSVKRFMEDHNPKTAVVIGGGYIGLEMADALTHKGVRVTLIEFAPQVLTTLDPELGRLIHAELGSRGVEILTGHAVERIERSDGRLLVRVASGQAVAADMVVVAAGAKPSVELANTAGIDLGVGGAIEVDRTMATRLADIWAAGDCVHTWHRILGRYVYMPLGTTAHKQGRVAGENMLGGRCQFQGSLGTQVVKVFDSVAARTGLRDNEARAAGFDPITVALTTWDHKVYYPGAKQLHIRLTGDRHTGRLLGAQMVGHRNAEVSKRIDIVAAALYNEMRIGALCDLDLSYTPPLSSPWDPVQMAAMQWLGMIRQSG